MSEWTLAAAGVLVGVVVTLNLVRPKGLLARNDAWEILHQDQVHLAKLLEDLGTVTQHLHETLLKTCDAVESNIARVHNDHQQAQASIDELIRRLDRPNGGIHA